MSIYVFLGPTLSVAEARQTLDAVFLPPVEQGDIMRLLPRQPRAIGIIDGRFQFVPSVWHKEILAALQQGIHVFGAASMGALRAAELCSFGMVGVGRIFESYRSGAIEDDDEVAVTHAEEGFRETSEAMVNIRDACAAAAEGGAVTDLDAEVFTKIAKSLYFAERTWARIFEIARDRGMERETIAAMDRFRRTHVPLKRRDALELLDRLAEFQRSEPAPFRPAFELERTVFLDRLQTEAEMDASEVDPGGEEDSHKVARKKVLLELLAVQEARREGIAIEDSDVREMIAWYRMEYGSETQLSDPEFLTVMKRFVAVMKIQEHHARAIERALPAHLAVTSPGKLGSEWRQWNVALSRETRPARESARALFVRMEPVADALRQTGALRQFYFMRKLPDIRLRFRGDASAIGQAIQKLLDTSLQQGLIERFFETVYEPEVLAFGGPQAMELVHEYFDADTRVWMSCHDVTHDYSVALLNDLFQATLGCANEVWQTWESLAEATGGAGPLPDAPLHLLEITPLHADANAALSTGLNRLWENGVLQTGVRAILRSVAMFHFNRYGIPGPEQAALSQAMAQSCNPGRSLRQHA